jgi:nucleoside-diphosphate-sugar epimerase
MKIFITGTTGFIGKNLVKFYDGVELYAYSRNENLSDALNYFAPDIIINCAAEIYKPELMWDSNVMMVKTCCDYVKNNTHVKMIQIGSSSEYGPLPRPSAETDRINPVDMYQSTKGVATVLCQGYARTYGLDICIARPYSVYGRYEKPHRLFPRLWKAFKLNTPMKLYDGEHDFIYIDDFVRGIDILVKSHNTPHGDIVNLGSGIQYNNFDVLKLFESISGHTAPVECVYEMAKSFESTVWRCDIAYARDRYNFTCSYDLKHGIHAFLDTADYTEAL